MRISNFKFQISNSERGQALLIIIMLMATSVTILLATTFTSRTNTQTTKLEEESQKALAAAEAGLEAALDQGTVTDLSTISGLSDFSGSAQVQSAPPSTSFVSPLLRANEQYTYYLSDYPGFANPYQGTLVFYYGSVGSADCNAIALELTIIYGSSPYQIKRYISDKGDRLGSNTDDIVDTVWGGGEVGEVNFACRTQTAITLSPLINPNPKVIIVRSLFDSSQIGVEGSSNLSPQGRTVTSEARSKTGVTKKVELFQSYPQIPADFFVTRL